MGSINPTGSVKAVIKNQMDFFDIDSEEDDYKPSLNNLFDDTDLKDSAGTGLIANPQMKKIVSGPADFVQKGKTVSFNPIPIDLPLFDEDSDDVDF